MMLPEGRQVIPRRPGLVSAARMSLMMIVFCASVAYTKRERKSRHPFNIIDVDTVDDYITSPPYIHTYIHVGNDIT
jgi:hypothetical protein